MRQKQQVQSSPRAVLLILLGLTLCCWLIFGQTRSFQYLTYDDRDYVYGNPHVSGGITADSVAWAFLHSHAANWHPLTWISHMFDCELFGLDGGAHHYINLLFHVANTLLLFLALRLYTGYTLRSGMVALLFAVHPQHVESVAWIAERKDVLSGFFFMLILLAYLRYLRADRNRASYCMVLLTYALGLACKASLVTVPFVLLLLDYWPLGRFNSSKVIPEKIPFFLLTLASCAITVVAQESAIQTLESRPFTARIGNAIVSYAAYILQFAAPFQLSPYYPYPAEGWPILTIAGSALFLATATGYAVFTWKSKPWILVGWFWYLGMLVPMIGLLQVGDQARADRYCYLSHIGIYILVIWTVAQWSGKFRFGKQITGIVTAGWAITLLMLSYSQTTAWRNDESLWKHAIGVDPANYNAHTNLGHALREQNRLKESIAHFEKAAAISPGYESHNNLGATLLEAGRADEALKHFNTALSYNPEHAQTHHNLALYYLQTGDDVSAVTHATRAVSADPNFFEAVKTLAIALNQTGETEAADSYFQRAASLQEDAEVHNLLGTVLLQNKDPQRAIRSFEKAIQLLREYPEAWNNLGAAWMMQGKPEAALHYFRKALRFSPSYDEARLNLARACLRLKLLPEARDVLKMGRPDFRSETLLGSIAMQMNEPANALPHFEQALQLQPRSVEARVNLAAVWLKIGDLDKATSYLEEAAQIEPGNQQVRNYLEQIRGVIPR